MKCPYCSYKATNHETLSGDTDPHEGDLSFCMNCGEVNQFKDGDFAKADTDSLDKDAKRELNDIGVAWLRSRVLATKREN